MGAGEFGEVLGGFMADILVPVVVLIICSFIPAAKRNPKIVYGICGLLVLVTAGLAARVAGEAIYPMASGVLAEGFLCWGYSRAAKKLRTVVANP
jgi:hypothetical protein